MEFTKQLAVLANKAVQNSQLDHDERALGNQSLPLSGTAVISDNDRHERGQDVSLWDTLAVSSRL